MSIKNQIFIGNFRPPANSGHAPRAKKIYSGIDSETGKRCRTYERTGRFIRISDKEWSKWRKVCK